jgi:glycosyltransferase involved in cell wall biosynthesis
VYRFLRHYSVLVCSSAIIELAAWKQNKRGFYLFTSIVICTRDRCRQLANVLTTLVDMDQAPLDWELIIVDNGSSDDTRKVAESFADRLPIRWVWEPVAGLSNARNKAVQEARGDYICWTDDDVMVGRGWLAAYQHAFQQQPDGAVFGGRIEPKFDGKPPAWLLQNRDVMAHVLAERDFGPVPVPLSLDKLPYGANFAVRRREMKGLKFDPALGVAPGVNRLGEETSVIRAILQSAPGYWVPNAKVCHIIPQARQTLAYVERYNIAAGETWAYEKSLAEGGRKTFPFWAFRGVVKASIALWVARLSGHASSPTTVSQLGYAKGVLGFYFRPSV